MNLLKGTAPPRRRPRRRLDDGDRLPLPGRDRRAADGTPVTVGIRPEHAEPGAGPARGHGRHRRDARLGDDRARRDRAPATPFTLARRGISRARPATGSRSPSPSPSSTSSTPRASPIGARADWREAYLQAV